MFCAVDGYAQCPVDIPLTLQPDNCLGTVLTVGSISDVEYKRITWLNGNTSVSVVNQTPGSTSGVTVAGGNGEGSAANQLHDAAGLFVDDAGNIYVVDVDNSRVQKWAPGATSGVTVAGGNGTGNAANQLNYPIGLAVAAAGNLFIADASNNRIQEWAPGATSGITVAGGNGTGNAANQLADPTRVVVDKNGDLYIGDSNNNRVQKWTPGATSGITVAGGNGAGSAANQLYGVYGLALDNEGDLFVSDNGNNRVQEWLPGSTSGITVVGGTGFGNAPNQLGGPAGLFIDKDDNLYVGDYYNERVMRYAPGESSGILVAGGNGQGNAANQFYEPECTFVDDKGNLYVSDAFNSRVQKWAVSSIDHSYTPLTAGTFTAVIEMDNGCVVTSNALFVNPIIMPSIIISTPNNQINACSPISFAAVISNGGSQPSFQWQVNGQNTGTNEASFTSDQIADGDQVSCILTSNAICATTAPVTSNVLKIAVSNGTAPRVSINTASAIGCSGTAIRFNAELTPGSVANSYQWKVNGNIAGTNSADFTDLLPENGDTITCIVDIKNGCSLNISNYIVITVYPVPKIEVGQIYYASSGQGVLLNPIISGDIQSFHWTPGNSLSDSTIRNPVANPTHNTDYLLKIISVDGCEAQGKVSVKVSSALKIPNAFSPNNDGVNDIFNIVGGTNGSRIDQFTIFNRWGQAVFTAQNKTPNNNSGGWDGYFQGKAAPEGAYVYFIQLSLPDGTKEIHKGTLILIR